MSAATLQSNIGTLGPCDACGLCKHTLQSLRLLPKSAYKHVKARLKMCGNVVVPQQAALAMELIGLAKHE